MLQFLSPKKEDSPCWNSGLIRKSRLLKINHFNYYPLNLYWVISISTIAFRYHFNVYRNWGYFLICRYFKLHFAQSNPTGLLYRLFTWVPIALLFVLIFVKTMPNLLIWGVQGIAFMALAAFIFSPQSLFNK